MKAYMGFSRSLGAEEGAVLVFAHDAREARELTYENGLVVDEWIDTAVKWLRDPVIFEYADKDKLTRDEPHVIDKPPSCKACFRWGNPINEAGICSQCEELDD
jgi:hypothetical protein